MPGIRFALQFFSYSTSLNFMNLLYTPCFTDMEEAERVGQLLLLHLIKKP